MQPKFPPPRGPLPGPSYQPPSAPPIPVQGHGAGEVNAGHSSGQLPNVKRGLQTSNQFLRTPIIRYSSVMRVGKQHPMRISLTGANGDAEPVKPQSLSGGFDPPILVQVTIPGALVTPTHQIIPLSGGDANFIVQPISSGKLKGAKVDFLAQGRKISEIPLPIRANKGEIAKFLVALGILIPLLVYFLPELTFRTQLFDDAARRGADAQQILQDVSPTADSTPAGNSSNSKKTGSTSKTGEKTPGKAQEKKSEKTPGKPSAFVQPEEFSTEQLPVILVGYQVPSATPEKAASAEGENSLKPFQIYREEDAIWAWTRNKLRQNGYATNKVIPLDNPNQLLAFFTIDRTYEITGEPKQELSSNQIAAKGLYYLEPIFRWFYRIFIDIPRKNHFELWYASLFITLGIIAWVLTSPNRKKIKGSVMDIRLAS